MQYVLMLLALLATALPAVSGCDTGVAKEDLGDVVFEIPSVPGAEKPYEMPVLGPRLPPSEDPFESPPF